MQVHYRVTPRIIPGIHQFPFKHLIGERHLHVTRVQSGRGGGGGVGVSYEKVGDAHPLP